jgi:hypothetical protein
MDVIHVVKRGLPDGGHLEVMEACLQSDQERLQVNDEGDGGQRSPGLMEKRIVMKGEILWRRKAS